MKIILIRHGQTDENKEGRYLGHYDAPINNEGREQITNLVKMVRKKKLGSICYSSDLLRTVETSEKICKEFSLELKVYPELRELHFGEWDCHTYNELNEKYPEQLNQWIMNPFEISPPNGETLSELGARIDQWIEQTILSQLDDDCVIITHGGPIRWILSKWIEKDQRQFWNIHNVRHGEGIIIEIDKMTKKWKIVSQLTLEV